MSTISRGAERLENITSFFDKAATLRVFRRGRTTQRDAGGSMYVLLCALGKFEEIPRLDWLPQTPNRSVIAHNFMRSIWHSG